MIQHNYLNMSGNNRNTKGTSSKNSGAAVSEDKLEQTALKKRSIEQASDIKSWAGLNRRAFITKGCGTFKENLVMPTGLQKNLFWILGTCADGKILVLQVWGGYAKKFHDLFVKLAEPDFAPTLWVVPLPKAKGLYFREMKANDFQRKNHDASFCLVLEYAKQESAPFEGLTQDAFPSTFEWSDGQYELNGELIPHFADWGKPLATPTVDLTDDLANYVPPIRTYYDASPPPKERRTVSSASSKQIAPSDLEFCDD